MTGSNRLKAWLDRTIVRGDPGDALPTQSSLATTFGISERTVFRVLQGYHEGGQIVRIPGKGSFLAPGKRTTSPAKPAWAAFADLIKESIRSGRILPGSTLSPVYSCASRHHLTPATISRAYHHLVDTGVVVKTGKQFRVAGLHSSLRVPQTREVLFFTDETFTSVSEAENNRQVSLAYTHMENVLSRNGYFVRYESLESFPRLMAQWNTTRMIPWGQIFFKVPSRQLVTVTATFSRSPLKSRFDDTPKIFDLPRPPGGKTRFPARSYTLIRSQSAWAEAQALRDYIVQSSFNRVNLFLSNHPIQRPGEILDFCKIIAELSRIGRFGAWSIVMTPAQHRDFLHHCASWEFLPIIESLLDTYAPRPPLSFLDSIVTVKSYTEAVEKSTPATCNIFQSDKDATDAVLFARARGLTVGKTVSILSLESDPSFFLTGLTRCQIDAEQLGYRLAHAIIGDIGKSALTKNQLLFSARIIEKMTTPRKGTG